jgi:hypothetical protein
LSKSNASVVCRYIKGIKYSDYGFTICLDGPNRFYKDLKISGKSLITLLKLLHPQELQLSSYLGVDFAYSRQLPRLKGIFYSEILINCLDVGNSIVEDSTVELIDCLHLLSSQLNELECDIYFLMLPNFPILSLNRLNLCEEHDIIQGNLKLFCVTNRYL